MYVTETAADSSVFDTTTGAIMSDSIPVTPTDTGARNTSVPTPSGKLKDAEDIEWYYSESSITPMNVSDQRKYGM